jgi:hypothetical protein
MDEQCDDRIEGLAEVAERAVERGEAALARTALSLLATRNPAKAIMLAARFGVEIECIER